MNGIEAEMVNRITDRSRRNLDGGVLGRLGWLYVLIAAPVLYGFRVFVTRSNGSYDWGDASAVGLAVGVVIVGLVLLVYERSRPKA